MTVAAKPLMAAINHLLAREAWAREKLTPYAGRRARVAFPLGNLDLEVQPDGLFGPVAPMLASAHEGDAATTSGQRERETQAFDVTIAVEAGAAPAFLSGGQAGAMKHVRIEGDAEFATALGYLAEHLRWEPEEDLARLIGDAGAYRAATLARDVAERAKRTGRNLIESVAEFLLDEDPQLVRRGELDTLTRDLTRTRDDQARLEKRLERLERQAGGASAAPKHADGTH
ncbi:ubiquinone biosynthesis protein UbiJ [Pararobbsia alpina]|uniref:ubiquinone biosynthesis accessory factor UbiJ n=1 Tax=Pararobbsia alpina TaxID=621374 RepID=UPI0039A47D88